MITKRSPIAVALLPFVTFLLYYFYWLVKTKREMVDMGASGIPTSLLLLVPIANWYYLWRWCKGVEYVTRGKMTAPVCLLLFVMLGPIGAAIVQDTLNDIPDQRNDLPQARVV